MVILQTFFFSCLFRFTSSYQKCEVNYNIGRASNITLPNNANVELSIYIKFYIYGKSSTTLDRLIFSTGQNIEFIFQMGGDIVFANFMPMMRYLFKRKKT